MLDYSDEGSMSPRVRKRSLSPFRSAVAVVGHEESLEKKNNGLPVIISGKAQSIFKEFREKSSKLILPKSNPRVGDPFIVSEFVPSKPFKTKSELQNFGLNFKGSCLDHDQSNGEDHPNSFYKSMRCLVLLAQFFAVLPVSGIRGYPKILVYSYSPVLGCSAALHPPQCLLAQWLNGPNYKVLTFKWIHYKTGYWALTLLGTVFCFVCSIASVFRDGIFEAASGILYFACGILSSLLMLSLSQNWGNLNREFANVELKLHKYGYPKNMGIKFTMVTVIVLLAALVEHILSKLKNFERVLACSQPKDEFYSLAKSFFLFEYSEVFSLFSYSLWKGILVVTAHFLVTANWNFKDLFLGFISWTIAERFKQVHELLDRVHGQDKSVSFWKEVREDFNSLSVLTKRVDNYIRGLMFLSFGSNLFFICIQLFHSLKKKLDAFRLLYFFWSFGFLVLRTGFVAFSAAMINDESKEPKTILYSVPQKNYTAEVRRFLTQLTTNEVALTGSGFFSITRSLILTITGSVITYEIVLVQFGGKETDNALQGNRSLCLFLNKSN